MVGAGLCTGLIWLGLKPMVLSWKTPKSIKDRSLSVVCYALSYHHMSWMGRVWLNNLWCLRVFVPFVWSGCRVDIYSHMAQEGASGGWIVRRKWNLSGHEYSKIDHCKGLSTYSRPLTFGSEWWHPGCQINWSSRVVWVKMYQLCRVESIRIAASAVMDMLGDFTRGVDFIKYLGKELCDLSHVAVWKNLIRLSVLCENYC